MPKSARAETVHADPYEVVRKELPEFGRGRLMRTAIAAVPSPGDDTSSFQSMIAAYIALGQIAKKIEARMSAMKPLLGECAQRLGATDNRGSSELQIGEDKVIREIRISSLPNPDLVRALLETKGIETEKAFDTVEVEVLNASKLQHLVQTGKLKQKEVDALRDVNYAVKGQAGATLSGLIREALGNSESTSNPDRRTPKPR